VGGSEGLILLIAGYVYLPAIGWGMLDAVLARLSSTEKLCSWQSHRRTQCGAWAGWQRRASQCILDAGMIHGTCRRMTKTMMRRAFQGPPDHLLGGTGGFSCFPWTLFCVMYMWVSANSGEGGRCACGCVHVQ